MIRTALFAIALMLCASASSAQITPGTPQVAYVPGQAYALFWDASPANGTAPENAVVGYQMVVAREIQTGAGNAGVQIKTYDLGNVTTFSLPGADLGGQPVFVSVRAKAANGLYSGHSNTLPFVPASAPAVPGRLRRTASPAN